MLRFMEGFEVDRISTHLARKYDAGGSFGTNATGRFFGNGRNGSFDFHTRSFGLQDTWIVGFGLLYNASSFGSGQEFRCELFRGADRQITVASKRVSASEWRIVLLRGATEVAESSPMPFQVWVYVEVSVTVHDSTGAYEIRVNQVEEFSDTGVDTSESGDPGADVVRFYANTSNFRLDDVYVCDAQGTDENDFLGDSVVEGALPDADGNLNQWTPSTAGNHYVLLDDPATSASDADDVSTDVVNEIELFGFPALSFITGAVHGVQLNVTAKLGSAGFRTMRAKVRSGGTNYDGDEFDVAGIDYQTYVVVVPDDPDTVADWDQSTVDAAEFGFELVS